MGKACDETPTPHKNSELRPILAAPDLAETSDDTTILDDPFFKALYNSELVGDPPDQALKRNAHNFAHRPTVNHNFHKPGMKQAPNEVFKPPTTLKPDPKRLSKAFDVSSENTIERKNNNNGQLPEALLSTTERSVIPI